MKKIILFLALSLPGWAGVMTGQTAQRQAMNAIAKPGSNTEWLKIKDNVSLTASNFFQEAKTALELSGHDELKMINRSTDELGMTHFRFQQFAHGYKVFGAEFMLHEEGQRVVIANGKIACGLGAPKAGTLTAPLARYYALEAVPSINYLWLNEKAEKDLKERTGDAKATFFPTGELVWVRQDWSQGFNKENLQLAWLFEIHTGSGNSARVFVDAYTGEVLNKIPLDIHCDPGTGNTTWNGTVNISTDQVGPNFILLDDCQAPNIHVFNSNDSSSIAFATEYTDADNNWTNTSAVQTFFGLRQSWQYFLTQHGRDSYNNGGANINGYNEAGFLDSGGNLNWSNASWSPGLQVLRFGDNNTGMAGDDWNTVDIVGHEFAHAVTNFSADLVYQGESGALNESFSDIFGEMIELFTEGSMDWLVGGDRGAIRSLAAPGNFNDPDTYLGTNWFNTASMTDNGGVHTNSGVQNHWFYLLSVGGTGTDDNGDFYEVQGIGAPSAALIAYRNLTVYLGVNSDYDDAKNGAIQAAADIFGACSNEVLQTARAWNAVGVYATDDIGYDIEVDCIDQAIDHALLLPYNVVAFNDIRSDCNIIPNGTLVEYQAGHTVLLKPGFRSGDEFHAFISPCGPMPGPMSSRSMGNDWAGTHPLQPKAPLEGIALEVFPNPFSGQLSVRYELPAATTVSITILDALGKRSETILSNEAKEAGAHALEVSGDNLRAGIYFIEIKTENDRSVRKVVKTGNN